MKRATYQPLWCVQAAKREFKSQRNASLNALNLTNIGMFSPLGLLIEKETW